jgi:hypothetical protein
VRPINVADKQVPPSGFLNSPAVADGPEAVPNTPMPFPPRPSPQTPIGESGLPSGAPEAIPMTPNIGDEPSIPIPPSARGVNPTTPVLVDCGQDVVGGHSATSPRTAVISRELTAVALPRITGPQLVPGLCATTADANGVVTLKPSPLLLCLTETIWLVLPPENILGPSVVCALTATAPSARNEASVATFMSCSWLRMWD